MRYSIVILSVILSVIPAIARDVVLAPDTFSGYSGIPSLERINAVYGGKGEIELSWDDGTQTGTYFSGGLSPYATTFTAPAACHLLTYRYFWYNGSNMDVDALLYADDGGGTPHTPTGSTLFTVGFNSGTTHQDWIDVDVSGENVTFSNGEIFHPGWSFASGTGKGVYCDSVVGGSYSCWVTDSSNWDDRSGSYTFMVRAVVNDDMDGPVAAAQDPADGDVGVAVDVDILFDIDDSDIGVDSSTITTNSVIVVEDGVPISGTLTVDDADPNNVHVTFDPDSDFTEGTSIAVTVSPAGDEITDDLGNEMVEDSWGFEVIASGVEAASLGEIKAEFK